MSPTFAKILSQRLTQGNAYLLEVVDQHLNFFVSNLEQILMNSFWVIGILSVTSLQSDILLLLKREDVSLTYEKKFANISAFDLSSFAKEPKRLV